MTILAAVWSAAITGVALKMATFDRMSAAGGAMYIALGWVAIVALPQIVHALSTPAIALLFAGGILYTGGAVVLARRRPNPNPRVFGYHEVWHSMVVGASVCHYAMILMLASAAR